MSRLRFALRYALRHFLISVAVAALSAAVVYGLLYPPPWYAMLGVGRVFALILMVDVVCGPLLTLLLASPRKTLRARWVDFITVGLLQLVALTYGLHSVWLARPVALAFERDRLVLVTANEIDASALPKAPRGLRRLPWWGVRHLATRRPANNPEFFQTVELGFAGISPAMRPDWWLPWEDATKEMDERARPLATLISQRPQDADVLVAAARDAGLDVGAVRYLPLISRKTREWVALLDANLKIVGHAPVDGFLTDDSKPSH